MQTSAFDPLNANSGLAAHANRDIIEILFGHTLKVAVGHAIASLLMILWLSDKANLTELTTWFCVLTCVSCFRLFLYGTYRKYSNHSNQHLWLHAWAGCAALVGCLYAIALVYFTPLAQTEYTLVTGLITVTLSALAVLIYGASLYAVCSFVLPLMLIPSYFIFSYGGPSANITLLIMGTYSLAILKFLPNISQAFKKTSVLSFQHQQEIDRRKQVEHQLQEVSRRDGLTGLFNRRYFDEMLEAEIGRAQRSHQPLCVLMFDIDCFKKYNLTYGHVAGDNCLVNIAELAQNLANRKGDLMARYGGEEFAIILPNIDLKGAVAFANKLQHEIQKTRMPHESTKLTTLKCVTISVGVTNLLPFTKVKPHDIIKDAETALFEAKRQGRNRVHVNENNGPNRTALR